MMIHEVTKLVGKHKRRKRIGRGPASGHGKTSGRGHKGAKSRSGWGGSITSLYQGGAMPYYQRIPKRGFSNAKFRKDYAIVNLFALEAQFKTDAEVNPEMLMKMGLVENAQMPVKILGDGELTKKLDITAHKFSASARTKIEAAGGSCTLAEK